MLSVLAQTRLMRLKILRRVGAPQWIVKSEQVALALEREGLRYAPIGRTPGKRQAELVDRHVRPLMEKT